MSHLHQSGGRVDECGSPNGHKNIGTSGCVHGTLPLIHREHLAEPDNPWAQDTPAAAKWGKVLQGRLLVPAFPSARSASQQPDVTMQLHHILAACSFVKAIHILGYQGEPSRGSSVHLGQGDVPSVRLRGVNEAAQPVIPFPNQAWIA